MKHLMIVLTVALLPAGALAARLDGNGLQARCSTNDVKSCAIYLDGFAAALSTIPSDRRAACVPEGVNGLQMRDVVLKYLRNTPEARQKPAADLIAAAFAKAWPCHG